MPTLRSVGVQEEWLERLSSLDPPVLSCEGFLQRHPERLCEQLGPGVTLTRLLQLCDAVRDAVLCQRQQNIVQIQRRYEGQDDRENGEERDGDENSNNDGNNEAIVVGAVTALSRFQFQNQHQLAPSRSSSSLMISDPCICPPISTMCPDLDSLLGGASGIRFGQTTQFSGPPACGKTQLALLLAAQHASSSSDSGGRVYYFASAAGHCPAALVRRLKNYLSQPSQVREVLQNIHMTVVRSAHQLCIHLHNVEQELLANNNSQQPCLIILDSASGCLNFDYAYDRSAYERTKKYNNSSHHSHNNSHHNARRKFQREAFRKNVYGLIRRVRKKLTRLAKLYSAAVVVINGSVRGLHGAPYRPAMGKYWQVFGDIHIWMDLVGEDLSPTPPLSSSSDPGVNNSSNNNVKSVRATLQKHTISDERIGDSVTMQLSKFGLQNVGDPVDHKLMLERFGGRKDNKITEGGVVEFG